MQIFKPNNGLLNIQLRKDQEILKQNDYYQLLENS